MCTLDVSLPFASGDSGDNSYYSGHLEVFFLLLGGHWQSTAFEVRSHRNVCERREEEVSEDAAILEVLILHFLTVSPETDLQIVEAQLHGD